MQVNKYFKIPEKIISIKLFVAGLLFCGFAAFFWLSAFDEIWNGYNINFLLLGVFIFFMSAGIILILLALDKQIQTSKKFTFKVIGAILIVLLELAIWSSFQKTGIVLPGKNYATDYVSNNKKYEVKVLYDKQKHPADIEVVDIKSGGVIAGLAVAGIKPKVNRYETKETTSSLVFIFYDVENKIITSSSKYDTYEFNTETGKWIIE